MELWRRREARIPLLIDVPHAGTHVPRPIAARFAPAAQILPDTDWNVDRLFDFSQAMGAGFLAATHARYVVDLNRDPSGRELYPAANNTELVPLTRFDWGPIYKSGEEPDAAEVAERVQTYWWPYHAQLAADIDDLLAKFGYCILLDGHSIPHRVPRFFEGDLPDLNLGTSKGASAAPHIVEAAWHVLDGQQKYSRIRDGRFTGGYITRHYGQPKRKVHALQIEIVQATYMDESAPRDFAPERAGDLIEVLKRMAEALLRITS